jgi:hypothetical protein
VSYLRLLRVLRDLSLTFSFLLGAPPAQDWNREICSLRPADVREEEEAIEEEEAVLDNLQRRAENVLAGIPRAHMGGHTVCGSELGRYLQG